MRRAAPRIAPRSSGVERVKVEGAAVLATFDRDHEVWELDREARLALVDSVAAQGAIIRVRPPGTISIEEAREFAERLKAVVAGVKLLPPAGDVDQPVVEQARREAVVCETLREVVRRLIDEARTEDRDALSGVVVEALDHAGV